MKSEKICYKMVITNQVCRGGGGALNSLNKALFGGLPLAYLEDGGPGNRSSSILTGQLVGHHMS